MQQKHNQTHDESNVDQSTGYVKREKPKQPKYNQNCGNYPQHFVSSLVRNRASLNTVP
jgi:hypothetical protein